MKKKKPFLRFPTQFKPPSLAGESDKRLVMNLFKKQPLPDEDFTAILAGAAKRDITPAPGMPMAGYSMMGNQGQGVRTRLFARAVYLKPPKGRPVVWVVCDLLAGSLLLHHKVAELIAGITDVESGGMMIAGTHTHSAPGNFFATDFYNQFASGGAGFEKKFFDFLASRITEAVKEAYDTRRPALVAAGKTSILRATRNRSLAAFQKNTRFESAKKPGQYEAVNPHLHMVRVDCADDHGEYHPLAALSCFSIHPTALCPKNDLYNADVFAYMEREVEWGILREYAPPWQPVHAAANHTHGDNTPDIPKEVDGGFIEAKRIGKLIGQKAFDLFRTLEKDLASDAPIAYTAREVDVQKEPEMGGERLARRPAVGASTTAGATSRSTPILSSLPFIAPGWGRKFYGKSAQGAKRVIGGVIQYLYLPKQQFPHRLFLQALQVGPVVFLPLPFEITYEAGRMMMNEASRHGKAVNLKGATNYVVVGVSNGYWGYVTTPEEYSLQYYEGGHTLYGPKTAPFLAARLGRLVMDLSQKKPSRLPDKWKFDLQTQSYLPRKTGKNNVSRAFKTPWRELEAFNKEGAWGFSWEGPGPGDLAFWEPLVKVQCRAPKGRWKDLYIDGVAVDDQGYDISVRLAWQEGTRGIARYEARWHDPRMEKGKKYRFAILERDEPAVFSEAFG